MEGKLAMCGRAKLPLDYSEIKIKLKLDDLAPPPNWEGSWNLAPTQDMLTVVLDPLTGKRVSVKARWGLIPHWAKDPSIGAKMFNARCGVENREVFESRAAKSPQSQSVKKNETSSGILCKSGSGQFS